jgi:CheY-like chemotaxis protein
MGIASLLGEDVELSLELAADACHVLADRGQLEQVVLNLAVNARDSMPGGGRLELRTERRTAPEETWCVIAVSDSGKGISPEDQERIFEPFFSTRVLGRGSGLGLATAYGIVDQSGGALTVDSRADQGTTFEVRLPSAPPPEVDDPPSPQPRSPVGGERLLLVEDERSVRAALRTLLETRGFQVEEAEDAESALELMATAGDGIALTITDMVLPGMSGAELAVELRSSRPGAPILFISGYSDEAVHGAAGLEHGTAFLGKPFSADALERTIRGLLEARLG